jgi:hypothetical protein
MPTPKLGYRLKDGTRVPGTTTIIGRFKESGGLIAWAWQCGIDGKDYREVRDAAANAGTLAHKMVENWLHKIEPREALCGEEDAQVVERAIKAFDAFLDWQRGTKLEVLAQEMQLVSETYRYGGTPDAIGQSENGQLVLLDWKTSNRIYADYLLQLAAYRQLWHECNPGDLLEGAHLLRFGKEHGDFHHHSFPTSVIDQAWEAFRRMRELYELDKELKRVAA